MQEYVNESLYGGSNTSTFRYAYQPTVQFSDHDLLSRTSISYRQGTTSADRPLLADTWRMPTFYHRNIQSSTEPAGWWRFFSPDNEPYDVYRAGNLTPFYGNMPTSLHTGWDKSHYDRALTKAMLSIKSSDWNAAQTLAEAGETARTMANLAASTAKTLKSLRDLRRGKFPISSDQFRDFVRGRGWKDRNKELAGRWLEYRYGIQPTVNDVSGAAVALAKAIHERPPVITGKGSVWEERTIVIRERDGEMPYRLSKTGGSGCFVRLDFLPENYGLALARSLGLTNIPALAYELVPLSFVLDWFLPIGDFLSCFDYSLGLTWKSGSYTRKSSWKAKLESLDHPDRRFSSSVNGTSRQVYMTREPYYGPPVVPPVPGFKAGLNFKRMADSLSLLSTRVR